MVEESQSVLGALHLLDGLVELSDLQDLPEERRQAVATGALAKLDSAARVLTNPGTPGARRLIRYRRALFPRACATRLILLPRLQVRLGRSVEIWG
jgi:hypothetical protein